MRTFLVVLAISIVASAFIWIALGRLLQHIYRALAG